MLRALGPVIFERLLPGALINAPVHRLIGFVSQHALGILQVRHFPFRPRSFPGEQILEKFP